MILKKNYILNVRQKINLAILLLIPFFFYAIFGMVAEIAQNKASALPEVILADKVSVRINANRAVYDMLKNTNPQYVRKNVLEGAKAENFTGYFGPEPGNDLKK
ncbi:MAG: hypothetical protein LBH05_06230 [Deferribacteraceae bacterium]|jgi:hypothetical protein|nr:hypothetical protein [Deferribacteraceae bacterium]